MKRVFSLLFVMSIITPCFAQKSYFISNKALILNNNCDLRKLSLILPVPQSCSYQDIEDLSVSSGDILVSPSGNKYLRDVKTSNLPNAGEQYVLSEDFTVTLYPMYVDMEQFTTIYPYDTNSEIYKIYTSNKGLYIDTNNPLILSISDKLWEDSQNNVLLYAKNCYEYVAANYRYLNPNTGIHPIDKILKDGGGDCGNLASIYVNLLRAKHIPAKHIVTVRPDGSYHVWADFYLEKYGWIPVDVNMKLDHPNGNYFGYCKGDGIVMSEDIFYDIEFESGSKYEVVLLQTFYYWYWLNSGNSLFANHEVTSELLTEVEAPYISKIEDDAVILRWNKVQGASSYRVRLFEKKNQAREIYSCEVDASETSLSLSQLKSDTEYEVVYTPIRIVDNIETMMGDFRVDFKTTNTTTGIESLESSIKLLTVPGQLNIKVLRPLDVSVYTISGQCIYKNQINTEETIPVDQSFVIVRVSDGKDSIYTKKVRVCK